MHEIEEQFKEEITKNYLQQLENIDKNIEPLSTYRRLEAGSSIYNPVTNNTSMPQYHAYNTLNPFISPPSSIPNVLDTIDVFFKLLDEIKGHINDKLIVLCKSEYVCKTYHLDKFYINSINDIKSILLGHNYETTDLEKSIIANHIDINVLDLTSRIGLVTVPFIIKSEIITLMKQYKQCDSILKELAQDINIQEEIETLLNVLNDIKIYD